MRTNALVFVFVAALAGLGAGCGEEEVPLYPSYEADVKPLMGARCIRCHGAGGTLNTDPDSKPTLNLKGPTQGDFTRLEDVGMIFGLMHYTGPEGSANMRNFLKAPMPPPPAPPLTDREKTILLRWIDRPLP